MNKEEYKKMYNLEDTHFWFVAKRYFVDSLLQPIRGSIGTILDLGCGTGGMTKHLSKYGSVTGVERSTEGVKFTKKRGIRVFNANINKIPSRVGKYNLVTLFDVLYHKDIVSPEQIIKESKSHLRKGGFLLITDSAFSFLNSSHDSALGGARRFTTKEIKNMLVKNKLTPVRSSYIYFSIFPLILIRRLFLDKLNISKGSDVKSINNFLNSCLLRLLHLEAIALKWVSFPLGSSLIVLAKNE